MSMSTIGDQSSRFLIRRQTQNLKAELNRLTEEMSSGKRVRPKTDTAADSAMLFGLERSRTALTRYQTATNEAALFTSASEAALATVADIVQTSSIVLVSVGSTSVGTQVTTLSADAKAKFATVVGALNSQVGGRALFGGTATDSTPLADPDTMLADLSTAIAGQTTAAGVEAVLDTWFGAGGGFETTAYSGNSTQVNFRIADGEDVKPGTTADHAALRRTLKGLAMAALANDPALAGSDTERTALAAAAGNTLLAADGDLTRLRADVGAGQSRIELRSAHHAAAKSALDIAEAKFTSADPYDTATALQEVSNHLEMLYTITSRLSNLSLVGYLR